MSPGQTFHVFTLNIHMKRRNSLESRKFVLIASLTSISLCMHNSRLAAIHFISWARSVLRNAPSFVEINLELPNIMILPDVFTSFDWEACFVSTDRDLSDSTRSKIVSKALDATSIADIEIERKNPLEVVDGCIIPIGILHQIFWLIWKIGSLCWLVAGSLYITNLLPKYNLQFWNQNGSTATTAWPERPPILGNAKSQIICPSRPNPDQ